MPDAWSQQDEEQYKAIKKSAMDRGRSESRAEEIAARTVNKRRQREGRTISDTSSATGNPNESYEKRTKEELYHLAQRYEIEGRSSMSKSELIQALRQH